MASAGSFEPESVRVTRLLRDEILDRARRPGDRLVERDLADELGVSRIPVRDALRALAGEGLVISRPRLGAVVREFSTSDIADLNEVRAAWEPLIFRLAALRRTREGLQTLKTVVDEQLAAAADGDAPRARRAAADFHETVMAMTANDLLMELLGPLQSRMRWLFSQYDDLMIVARQHAELYEAIAERDSVRAERLAVAHQDGHLRTGTSTPPG